MSDQPLRNLRVLDFADEKGELCGRLLADFGADVIRVEPPEGARSRRLPPFHAGESLYFAFRNAGKRGIDARPAQARGRRRAARAAALCRRLDRVVRTRATSNRSASISRS